MTEHIAENMTQEAAEMAFAYDPSGVLVGVVTGIALSFFILALLYSIMTSSSHKKKHFRWFYIMIGSLLVNVMIWFSIIVALVDIEGSELVPILQSITPFLAPMYYAASFLAAVAAVLGIRNLKPLLKE